MTPELLDVFRRVYAEISLLHGSPAGSVADPTDRFGEGREMVAATWVVGDTELGFKIYEGPAGIEIVTFELGGDNSRIRAGVRHATAADAELRRILPPAFGITQEAAR